jgi:hypothetical protein
MNTNIADRRVTCVVCDRVYVSDEPAPHLCAFCHDVIHAEQIREWEAQARAAGYPSVKDHVQAQFEGRTKTMNTPEQPPTMVPSEDEREDHRILVKAVNARRRREGREEIPYREGDIERFRLWREQYSEIFQESVRIAATFIPPRSSKP